MYILSKNHHWKVVVLFIVSVILTDAIKQKWLSVQRLALHDLDGESFVSASASDCNDIQSLAALKHEPNPLEHFGYVIAAAIHSKPRDYIDDANHTWGNQDAHTIERNPKFTPDLRHSNVIKFVPWMCSARCCIARCTVISAIAIVPHHWRLKSERKALVQASVPIFDWHAVGTMIWMTASVCSVLMVSRCKTHSIPWRRASVRHTVSGKEKVH